MLANVADFRARLQSLKSLSVADAWTPHCSRDKATMHFLCGILFRVLGPPRFFDRRTGCRWSAARVAEICRGNLAEWMAQPTQGPAAERTVTCRQCIGSDSRRWAFFHCTPDEVLEHVCVCVSLSLSLCVSVSVSLSLSVFFCLFLCLSLSLCLPVSPSLRLSLRVSLSLSLSLSVSLSLSPPFSHLTSRDRGSVSGSMRFHISGRFINPPRSVDLGDLDTIRLRMIEHERLPLLSVLPWLIQWTSHTRSWRN